MKKLIVLICLAICLCITPVIGYNWTAITLENGSIAGRYGSASSLSVNTTGYPGISYLATGENLNYTWWTGTGWGKQTVDDRSFGVGYYSSLKYNSTNNSSISYSNITLGGVPAGTWTDFFPPGAVGYSSKTFETWNGYIYNGASGIGLGAPGFIKRYPTAGAWENVLDNTYYAVYTIYSIKGFGENIYAAHDGAGIVNGGIAQSPNGSMNSFVQVFDSGSALSYVQALEVMGTTIYGMYYDNIAGRYKILSSTDGLAWNTIYTSATANDGFWGLTTSGTTLYTIYYDLSAWPPASSDIYSSADGITWVPQSWGFTAGTYPLGIKYLNGHLYAGLSNGQIWRDSVLIYTEPGGNGFYDFCECENVLYGVCGGATARVYASNDNGLTWSLIYEPSGAYTIMEAIGSLGNQIYVGSSLNWDLFQSPINSGLFFAQWNGAGWDYTTIDPNGIKGSQAINSTDYPKVAYVNEATGGNLYLAQWNGVGWDQELVDAMGLTPTMSLSLALNATENASIGYYNTSAGDLNFTQWDGTGWRSEIVDNVGDVGLFNSLAFNLTDNASISYYNATSGDLKFAQWNGTGWFNETVDSTGDVGLYTSLAFDSCDFPHISYFDNTNKNLKHAWRNNSGWFNETIDAAGNTGYWTSLAIDQYDNMYISYFNQTDTPSYGMGELKFAYYIAPPLPLPNQIYGLVLNDVTGVPINGATVTIWNATWADTNMSFMYSGFNGVYAFENLPPNKNYWLCATMISYTPHNVIVNSGAAGDAVRQDLYLSPTFTLTLNIVDYYSHALITSTPVYVTTSGTLISSTSSTTGILTIPYIPIGVIVTNITAAGYVPYVTSYSMTSDRNETVYMTPLTSTGSIVWYAPHPVRIVIVNEYGNKVQNATISANYNSSTMPYGWISNYYGINQLVAPDIVNQSLYMIGITGSDGSVTFTMQQALQYNVTIYNPGPPPSTSVVNNFEAKEDLYIIHIKTIADVISNYITYQDPLTISEPDINHIKFNINWSSNSSVFYSVNFSVICVGNGTVIHANGPNLNATGIMNFTVTNVRGEQWLMTESAYFTDGKWMNISRGVTAKGPSGVLVDLGLPSYYMYQWIAYALIFALGSMASQRNAHMFAVLVPVWAAMLVFFGWIPGGQIITTIGFCVAIGAFIYMRGSLRQKFGISGGYSILMSIFLWLIFFQACIGIINGLGIFTNNYAADMTTQYSNVDIGVIQTQFSGSTGLLSTIMTYIDLVTTAVWNAVVMIGNVVVGVFFITYFLAQVYPFIPASIWILVQIGDWVLLTMFFFTLLARPSPGTPGTDIT